MKKYFLSFFVVIAFVFYVILENQNSISIAGNPTNNAAPAGGNGQNNPAVPPVVNVPSVPQQPQSITPAPVPTPTPAPAPAPAAAGLYRDGTYDGDSADAYFGNVQVAAVIAGGKLTDVTILDYPQDRGTSVRINNAALPKLVQEAITSQSATVDVVSGATQTSDGFRQSLATALAKAKN